MTIYKAEDQTSTFVLRDGQVALAQPELTNHSAKDFAGIVIDSKYKIESLIGEGGMGRIYRARHILLNKDVALKTLNSSNLTRDFWERFQREVKSVANLNHPYVIKIFDFGVSEGNVPYYTMELLKGLSLAEYLEKSGPLPINEVCWIFTRIAAAMSSVHSLGVVHRDLKPANIFLLFEGDQLTGLRVLDFGIAKLNNYSTLESQKLTATGTIFGSPLYMSPEQALGVETDQRSDIYSFGCILFEALTGRPPFKGANALQTMQLHQIGEIEPLPPITEDTFVDDKLNLILEGLIARESDLRIQSFDEVTASLAEIEWAVTNAHESPSPSKQNSPFTKNQSSRSKVKQLAYILVFALFVGAIVYGAISSMKNSPNQSSSVPSDKLEAKSSKDFLVGLDEMPEVKTSKTLDNPTKKTNIANWRRMKKVDLYNIAKLSPQDVDLKNCSFDNNDLTSLSKLKLRYLNFNYSNLNDVGIKALGENITIENMRMQATPITDDGLSALSQIKTIKFLDLRNTSITDLGLERVSTLPSLRTLRIADTKATASGVRKFCENNRSIKDIELSTGKLIPEKDLQTLVKDFPKTVFADKVDLDKASSSLKPLF